MRLFPRRGLAVPQPFRLPEGFHLIKLRALGGLDLRDASGAAVDDLLRQPKRSALLAYLALAEPPGFQRRDAILALLWPDLDMERARAALRKSLYVLRKALGPDVILTRGDDEVGIDPEQLASDVAAFQFAITQGRLLEGLERYHGDLLAGFFVSDVSPEWEHWLDARRADLRGRAADAAWRHAKALADSGNSTEGLTWARWASARAPDDEHAVRRLLQLLGDLGDRAGAMQLYQQFRARLRTEYHGEPAPETQELMAAIRARASDPAAPPQPPPPEVADSTPLATSTAQRAAAVNAEVIQASPSRSEVLVATPQPRRWRRVALIAVPLIAIAAVGLTLWRPSRSKPIDLNLVAVAPFAVLSPVLDLWREGMVDLLSRNLDGAGPLRAVPPSRSIRLWAGERPDAETADALGERTGAGLVIFGSVLAMAGDSLRVSASVLDRSSGRNLGDIQVQGETNRMTLVVDSLTRELIRLVGRVRQIGSAKLASVGSTSVPALKAFLEGEQYYRLTSYDSAVVHYAEAIALDSTFAMAWLRLGGATMLNRFPIPLLENALPPESPWWLIYRAGTLNHGLARHDSLEVAIAAGIAAVVLRTIPAGESRNAANRVLATAVEVTRQYPGDAVAWYWLAVTKDALGDVLGSTTAETYIAYNKSIALDSGFAPAYRSALRISGRAGDISGTRKLAEYYVSLDPSPTARAIPLAILSLLDPRVTPDALRRSLDALPPEILWPTLIAIWRLPDSQEAAVRLARTIVAQGHDQRYWFTADFIVRRNLAAVLAYRGHFREALNLAGDERSTWFANVFAELAIWGDVPTARADSVFADWLANHPETPGLRAAPLWWVERRDTVALKKFLALAPERRPLREAFLALARRDTASALREFTTWHSAGGADFSGTLAMAQLMERAGNLKGALAVLNGREPNDWPIPSQVIWALTRARFSELAGDRVAATRDYQFVADIWRHADPELQPYVTEAREAVKRVRGGKPLGERADLGRLGLPGGLRREVPAPH